MRIQWSLISVLALTSLMACGNKGTINFHEDSANPTTPTYSNAGFNLVPASQARMVEGVATNGYQLKVQLNPQGGQTLTGGGYQAKIKFTSRSR